MEFSNTSEINYYLTLISSCKLSAGERRAIIRSDNFTIRKVVADLMLLDDDIHKMLDARQGAERIESDMYHVGDPSALDQIVYNPFIPKQVRQNIINSLYDAEIRHLITVQLRADGEYINWLNDSITFDMEPRLDYDCAERARARATAPAAILGGRCSRKKSLSPARIVRKRKTKKL